MRKRNKSVPSPVCCNYHIPSIVSYLFTSESVSPGHPDKIADQISDTLLDHYLAFDPDCRVACETLVTTGLVFLAGEVLSGTNLDIQTIVRDVIKRIGYEKSEYHFDYRSCSILTSLKEQSPEISRALERGGPKDRGAGDQGIMFGYAVQETECLLPVSHYLAHQIIQELTLLRREKDLMPYLRPDQKSQVTIEYGSDHKPKRIHTVVVSLQHDDFNPSDETMLKEITSDVHEILIPRLRKRMEPGVESLFNDDVIYHVNPTGKFVNGGPDADTGLTGRKIIVDTYGGRGGHGGGCFSGKDTSKVDRSAAYAARHIAKNIVAAGLCKEIQIQICYAIGVAQPLGIFVNTFGTCHPSLSEQKISAMISRLFDLRPSVIESTLQLRKPIYLDTAAMGHMGRIPESKTLTFNNAGTSVSVDVETFPWEKLDRCEEIRDFFKLG